MVWECLFSQRIGSPLLGFLLPAAIFLLSFGLTFWLIYHFHRKFSSSSASKGEEGND